MFYKFLTDVISINIFLLKITKPLANISKSLSKTEPSNSVNLFDGKDCKINVRKNIIKVSIEKENEETH